MKSCNFNTRLLAKETLIKNQGALGEMITRKSVRKKLLTNFFVCGMNPVAAFGSGKTSSKVCGTCSSTCTAPCVMASVGALITVLLSGSVCSVAAFFTTC